MDNGTNIDATEYDHPNLRDVHSHVVPNVADKWKDLGMELLNPKPLERTLEIIEGDNPHSVEKCCRQMFRKWLDTKVDANWSQLIMALKSIGLVSMANHIQNMLKKEEIFLDTMDMIPSDKFTKLLDDLKELFEEKHYTVCSLVIHLGVADKSGTTVFSKPDASRNVQTLNDIVFHLTKECKYYSYSLLQNFVEREEYRDATPIVEKYTKIVYSQLLEEMDLMTANEWVKPEECQPSKTTSILEVKIDAKRLLLKEENKIIEVFYKYLKLPSDCLHFIGAKPGSIILVYKMSVKIREFLLHLTARKLGILANSNITHLIIDNEMELDTMATYYDKHAVVSWNSISSSSTVTKSKLENKLSTSEETKEVSVSIITSSSSLEIEFAKMTAAVKEVLSKEDLNMSTLIEQLRISSAVKGQEVPLFDNKIFTTTNSVEDLWKLLSKYWSPYDYDILHFLINTIESKSAKHIYEDFLSRIDPSALMNVAFIPDCKEVKWQGLGKRLRVKVKAEKCTDDVQKTAKKLICKHFNLNIYSIVFVGIKQGCVELIFASLSPSTPQYMQTCQVTGHMLTDFAALKIQNLQTNDMELNVPSKITTMDKVFTWTDIAVIWQIYLCLQKYVGESAEVSINKNQPLSELYEKAREITYHQYIKLLTYDDEVLPDSDEPLHRVICNKEPLVCHF